MYITFYKNIRPREQHHQITFEEFLNGATFQPDYVDTTPTKIPLTVVKTKEELRNFWDRHGDVGWFSLPTLPQFPSSECPQHYHTFRIPKKSGGWREINAPDEELKSFLSALKDYFEIRLKILPHDAAHAYVKRRSTVTAIKKHQGNDSKWFLKLDMKNFFPNHNLEYVLETLKEIYPIGFLMEDPQYVNELTEALKYAFLDNKLPQGTPLSPTLTNICMIPIDYKISKTIRSGDAQIYTRYADDLLFSSKYKWDSNKTVNMVKTALRTFNAPFHINDEKTRYGSRNGANWNLGIMLNKDNRMTIGHKKNQRFRAALHNLIMDHLGGVSWESEDKLVLSGNISYYMAIDPEYTTATIARYEEKYNVIIKELLKI